jgi:alpha-L-rhamnosidase
MAEKGIFMKRGPIVAVVVCVLVGGTATAVAEPTSNLAAGRRCQVFSSREESTLSVARLTDGQVGSEGWSSKAFATHADHRLYPEFITLDLGANCVLDRVVLCPMEGGKGFPVDATIQICREGEPWRVVAERRGGEQPDAPQVFELGQAEGRFVKVEATRLPPTEDGPFRFQLSEFEVWGCLKPAERLVADPPVPKGETKVARLRCENRDDPVGMDAEKPRLSWWMTSDVRGQKQSAYRILVASSPEMLASDTGDLWDSGRTPGDASVAVRYAGQPLASGRAHAWKVMLWDNDGRPTPWSEPATFVTGKLRAEDWQGKWIGAEGTRNHPHGAVYLRRSVEVAKPVKRATVCVCGLGWSELAIDGQRVDDAVMTPGFTQYDKRTQYLVLDATKFFAPSNPASSSSTAKTIDVMLLDGWYAFEREPCWHNFHQLPYIDRPKLLLDLRLEHPDGTETVVSSDGSWQWSEGPITRSWLCEADEDHRFAPGEGGWRPVAVVNGPTGRLVVEKEPPTRVVEELRPMALENRDGTWVYVFDREFTGFFRFRTSGPRGTTIRLATRSIRENAPGIPARNFTCVLGGEGEEEFAPRQTYTAIARVYVTGAARPPALDDLVGCRISGVGGVSGGFRCSNDLVNWLHEAARRTQANYVTYLPNDPSREYKAWMEDPVNMFRSAVYLFDSQAMYERWQWDMLDGQAANGNVPNIAPGPYFDDYNSPWWGGSAVWLPWYWHLYYGDASLLESSYPAMKRYVDFLETKSRDGLQDWGLTDWLAWEYTPAALVNTPAAYLWARIVSQTAERLGLKEDAAHYARLGEEIRAKFNARFLDPTTGIYGQPGMACAVEGSSTHAYPPLEHQTWWSGDRPCTQAAQVLAITLGLVPDDVRSKADEALLREIQAHGNRLSTGFIATPCLLQWLAERAPAVGWELAVAQDFPSWYTMTAGSDSEQMMETWNGGQAFMPSLGGNLVAWNVESLGGIRPDPEGPGFKRSIIRPNVVGDLHWAESWYDSVYGRIASRWRKRGDQFLLDVSIPANTSATVFVPARDAESVREAEQPIDGSRGAKFLRLEEGFAVFEIGSGEYQFQSQPK